MLVSRVLLALCGVIAAGIPLAALALDPVAVLDDTNSLSFKTAGTCWSRWRRTG